LFIEKLTKNEVKNQMDEFDEFENKKFDDTLEEEIDGLGLDE